MMFGYHGRYLRVDLIGRRADWVPLGEEVLRRFLGGVGLGTYILERESPAGVDPFAPEAALVFSLSPLVGTPLTTSAKFAVLAKSPLTQRLSDALSSSHFALAAKKAGMDALVIVGSCENPSVLVIDEGRRHLGHECPGRDGPATRTAGTGVRHRGDRRRGGKPGALRHHQP
jgi:aldehyde:ferredoxin oxidoreductase